MLGGSRDSRWQIALTSALLAAGCNGDGFSPDQSQFARLETLATSDQAVARLYAAPLAGVESVAVHPWFVVKRAGASEFERWEVWPVLALPYGHVRKNRIPPEADAGAGGVFVVAELIGQPAEPVAQFVQSQSPNYPCRFLYVLLPGPNSSSYAQWILDNTYWNAALPPNAIGRHVPADCL